MNDKVRVRFAPSPTGPLHIGGVRTVLYNYLFAKKHKGTFILRIEDTDQTRFVNGAENYIIESLKWIGIKIDEGVGGENQQYAPYRQSERKEIYKRYAEQLINDGTAYYAFDTPEELEAEREKAKQAGNNNWQYDCTTRQLMKNSLTISQKELESNINEGKHYVIRIKIPENQEISVIDLIRGKVTVNSSLLDDKVLYKSDGMPTYHLANVVDDYLMKITHVIRGEEWLPPSPLHVLLYQYLGWEASMPEFAHLPLLLKPSGAGKLSKRDGDKLGFPVFPLEWKDPATGEISSGYKESGYIKEAFVNILAFLGWNPGTTQEIFSMEQLIDAFSLERVGKAGSRFDFEKAKWYNQQYIKALPAEVLMDMIKPLIEQLNIKVTNEYLAKVCDILKERITFPKEIIDQGDYFFAKPISFDETVLKKKWKDNTMQIINNFAEILKNTDDFSQENIEQVLNNYIKDSNIGNGDILPQLRLVITGKSLGPSTGGIISILGKEETLQRINEFNLRS